MDSNVTPTPRKRILVVSPWESFWSLGEGAGVSDDYHFTKRFTSHGFELHFLMPKSDAAPPPVDNLYIHTYPNFFAATKKWPTPLKRIFWPLLFNILVTTRLLSLCKGIHPDFLLGHSTYGAFPCYVASRRSGVPSGVKLFGVMDLVHTEWSRWKYVFKNFEQLVALKFPQDVWIILDDGTNGDKVVARAGVPATKIRFLPNGVNLEWIDKDFDDTETRRQLGVPHDASVILFLARLVESKRPDAFLRAIPKVVNRAKRDLVFLVVGDGPEMHRCKNLARSLDIEENVRFIGAIPHTEVPNVMAVADVFVSTSRLTNKSIPTCEALICGTPVVAFDVGTTREIIRSGKTGHIVPDGDIDALAKGITEVIVNDELREAMSKECKVFAREAFTDWDARIDMEMEIIDRVIGDDGTKGDTHAKRQ